MYLFVDVHCVSLLAHMAVVLVVNDTLIVAIGLLGECNSQ
jgi:hypothetical protein